MYLHTKTKRIFSILFSVIFLITTMTFCNKGKVLQASAYSTDELNKKIAEQERYMRAVWISSVVNLDWPSNNAKNITNTTQRIAQSKQEMLKILDNAKNMNMNAVFFQVSPEADALYASKIVPWSKYLTGTLGKDPGFDPLAFIVEEAHKRSIEVHAWFNPYRVSMNTKKETMDALLTTNSVYKEHEDWIRTGNDRFVVDPGIPEVRQWTISRVMEVVKGYDVDGINFDDYFYYEKYFGEINDKETYEKYNNGQSKSREDFRRNAVTTLIQGLSKDIKQAKPWVKFGISPAGVWGNKGQHPEGSNTDTSYTNYDKLFADTRKWVVDETIDYISPQIYFSHENSKVPFDELTKWWNELCNGKNVHLYISHALYKINDDSDSYFKGKKGINEIKKQLGAKKKYQNVNGSVLFRYKNLEDSGKQEAVSRIKKYWSEPAIVPEMIWKPSVKPQTPQNGEIELSNDYVKLRWNDNDNSTTNYGIYQVSNDELTNNLTVTRLATIKKNSNGTQEYVIKDGTDKFEYAVTTLNRQNSESLALVFKSNQNITRGEFAQILVKNLGLYSNTTKQYSDVNSATPYQNAIGIAGKLGILTSMSGKFYPERELTRQDMVLYLYKALKYKRVKLEAVDKNSLKIYSDAKKVKSTIKKPMATFLKYGIINVSNGKINPRLGISRSEVDAVFNKIFKV